MVAPFASSAAECAMNALYCLYTLLSVSAAVRSAEKLELIRSSSASMRGDVGTGDEWLLNCCARHSNEQTLPKAAGWFGSGSCPLKYDGRMETVYSWPVKMSVFGGQRFHIFAKLCDISAAVPSNGAPHPPQNNVSPPKRVGVGPSIRKHKDPRVWHGACNATIVSEPTESASPSLSGCVQHETWSSTPP